jgi:hypothetical protein
VSRTAVSVFRSPKLAAGRVAAIIEIWRRFRNDMFDPYRPELHYMRGPGPKSSEKPRARLVGARIKFPAAMCKLEEVRRRAN